VPTLRFQPEEIVKVTPKSKGNWDSLTTLTLFPHWGGIWSRHGDMAENLSFEVSWRA
jgi:hypothetical protein